MNKFERSMGDITLYTLLKLSRAEMEDYVKLRIQEFVAKPYTSLQLYNFMDSIAKINIMRQEGYVIGDISGFVQAVCDVAKHYVPPDPDEPRMIDLEWCEDHLSKP